MSGVDCHAILDLSREWNLGPSARGLDRRDSAGTDLPLRGKLPLPFHPASAGGSGGTNTGATA